jgi:hypothetical protein
MLECIYRHLQRHLAILGRLVKQLDGLAGQCLRLRASLIDC